MSTNPCAEHCIPAPQGLLPERLRPGELPSIHHTLVAAPHVVHQDVDDIGLTKNQIERRVHLPVVAMIATNTGDLFIEPLEIRGRAASDEDSRSVLSELARDTAANSFRGSCNDCHLTV